MSVNNIEVQVNKRVLWIGSDAYPLQNIARAQVRTLYPKRRKLGGKFVKDMARSIGVGIAAAIALSVAGVRSAPTYAVLIFAVLAIISVISLVRALQKERAKKPYHLLMIQTSGDPQTLLASPYRQQIDELLQKIMAAIDDAAVTYYNWIENHGDIISQYGYDNVGKINA